MSHEWIVPDGLVKQLSTEGAPAAIDPDVGVIANYAPWGNMAIFYKVLGHSPGLVRRGRIQSGAEALNALAHSKPPSVELIE